MEQEKTYNEVHVLKSLANGDSFAFTKVMDRHQDKVYSLALKILKSTALAEEIVQEVFLKIWLNRENMAAINNLGGYLHILTRNLVLNQLNKIAYERKVMQELSFKSPDNTAEENENMYSKILADAINQLPPKQQKVFRMAKLEGMSQKEIAENMGISLQTVKSHMAKALKTVRNEILVSKRAGMLLPILLNVISEV